MIGLWLLALAAASGAPFAASDPDAGALVAAVNQRRGEPADCATFGVRPAAPSLRFSPLLQEVARGHARDMAERGYIGHENLRGERVRDRARRAGYRGAVGENIAWSTDDARAVVGAWLRSAGHCANMMDGAHRETGVGVARSPGFGRIWVQVFGSATEKP